MLEAGDLSLASTTEEKEKLEQILGGDTLTTNYTRLHDIPVTDIDGNQLSTIGNILAGKKAILVVNVAPL